MKVLIDISHPAHIHLFKFVAQDLLNKGHDVLFTAREKEHEQYLLNYYGFSFRLLGRKYNSIIGKIWGIFEFGIKLTKICLKFRPDLILSHGSHSAAHASFLVGKPHIALEDTYNAEQIWLYKPFTKVILTSDYEHPLKSSKVLKYKGYHELAYLHPNRYKPDKKVLEDLGIEGNEKYILIRFVSWNASHDVGHKGISFENKLKAIRTFEEHVKVFISSEAELPQKIKKYKLNILPHRIHDVIANAALLFGESSTMAEEAAMLGTPSIYIYNNSTYYTKHLEDKFKLIFNYSESAEDQIKAIQKGIDLLTFPDVKHEFQTNRRMMLSEKIDVTTFLVWFIENWPESFRIMKENPEYQERFR